MKKYLSVLISLFVLFFMSGCAQKTESQDTLSKILKRGKLIVGVKYDTKPFGYLNQKEQLVGFDVDLAKALAKNILGSEEMIEFKPVTPSSRILALSSGEVDMIIATMTITKQRSEIIDFSIPYYITGQTILVPSNSDITSISNLNGKKVIVIFGTTAENNLRLAAPDAKILGFKTYTGAYKALKAGKADAITSDETILLGIAMNDKSVKLLPKKYSQEPYGIGLKKGEQSIRLKNKVNFIIKDMLESGEINSLKQTWIRYSN